MSTPVFELCDEYVVKAALLDPVAATVRGVSGVEAPPGTDYGPDGHTARADLMREVLRRLAELEPRGADDEAAAAHLRERLATELAWHEAGEPLRWVRAPFGPIQIIRDSVDLMPRTNEEAWRAVAARLAAVPEMLAGWRASLRVGRERGIVAAVRQVSEAAAQADRYAGLDGGAPTYDDLLRGYGNGPLSRSLAESARSAYAAFVETGRFLREEYAPAAGRVDGVGPERHALGSRQALGADIDPLEAYAWGWEELRRIEAELASEAAAIRPGTDAAEAGAILDETEYVTGADAYRAWLQDKHDRALDELHGRHFDVPEPLRRVEVTLPAGSSAGAPYYTPPSEDLSRPGRTWWPVLGRDRFATWRELTTVFHEGVPGHHLQVGTVRVRGDSLSRFSRMSGVSGHSEGWALYAERLADEMGWFTDQGSRLGMLKGSAVRAARVVIDIGVHLDLPLPAPEAERHGRRWTFDVACEVLRVRGGLAAHRVHPEVVRYLGWPGQAISYKLGERAWLAAREEAQRRSGPRFDLKRWHDQALALGPVGLDNLAAALRALPS